MNNNEKTFADLFLDSKDDDKVEDSNVTFDNILSNTDSISEVNNVVDKDSFSFNNLSFNANDEIIDEVKSSDVVEVKSTFEEISNNVDSVITDSKEIDVNQLEKDNFSDNQEINSYDFGGNNIEEFEKKENMDINDKEENNNTDLLDKDTNSDNIFLSGNVDDNNNNTFIKDVDTLDNIVEKSDNVDSNKVVENVENDVADINIFGFDNDKVDKIDSATDEISDINKEDSKNLEVNATNEASEINKSIKDDKVIEENIRVNNPLLSGDDDFVINSPLFSESISFDQSDNSIKKVNKLDFSKTKHFNVKVLAKKEPLSKFIIGVISYAFFIWLLLIGITLLVYVLDIKIRAAKGDYSTPTFNAYVVLTGSMLPEIQVNDVVVTKKVDANDLKVGDIITFASTDSRFAGTIITHRIIKKNPASGDNAITFQTKGDNNNVADSALVTANNIYGKVILKIPKLGYLQEFLATDGGWIIVILIPCLTVISYDIVKLLKGLKRKKYNNIKIKK